MTAQKIQYYVGNVFGSFAEAPNCENTPVQVKVLHSKLYSVM